MADAMFDENQLSRIADLKVYFSRPDVTIVQRNSRIPATRSGAPRAMNATNASGCRRLKLTISTPRPAAMRRPDHRRRFSVARPVAMSAGHPEFHVFEVRHVVNELVAVALCAR